MSLLDTPECYINHQDTANHQDTTNAKMTLLMHMAPLPLISRHC